MTRQLTAMVVHPGARYSIHDVARGLVRSLMSRDVLVGAYNLADRIEAASQWVAFTTRRARRAEPGFTLTRDERLNRVFDRAAADILPMALDNGVDAVIIPSAMFVPGQTIFRLQRAGLNVILLLTEAPYDDERHRHLVPLADWTFVNEATSVPVLQKLVPGRERTVQYFPCACDPAVHRPIEPTAPELQDVPAHDVVFVGTAFRERAAYLAAINWTGIDLGLYGNWSETMHSMGKRTRAVLEPHIRGELVQNEYASKLYAKAKIGLNLFRTSVDFAGKQHVDADRATSPNPRTFELAATGTLQLSNWRSGLERDGILHEGGVPTMLTAETPAEAEATIRQALADIAAGQVERYDLMRAAALAMSRRHTFDAQIEPVIAAIREGKTYG